MSIAKAGDQVILPRPHYFNHDMWLRMPGRRAGVARLPAGIGRDPQRRRCRQIDRPETRAIVLISPNNPTGAV